MRRVAIAVLLLAAASVAPASAGLETPEDAVREYLAGVTHGDVDRILAASAVDEMVDGFRFDEEVDRHGSFQMSAGLPVHEPFFADLQRVRWQWQLLSPVLMLTYSLLAPSLLGDVHEGLGYVYDVDADWAHRLEAQLRSERLSGLVVADIAVPVPEITLRPGSLVQAAEQARLYGADEQTERIVLFTFEGDLYFTGFTLLRYDDVWKVQVLSSIVARICGGMSEYGAASPITVEEWEELVSEEVPASCGP